MARGREAARQPQHDHHAHRQQERRRAQAGGVAGGRGGVRQGARPGVLRDVRQDQRQRGGGFHQHRLGHLREDRRRAGREQRIARDQGWVRRRRRREQPRGLRQPRGR